MKEYLTIDDGNISLSVFDDLIGFTQDYEYISPINDVRSMSGKLYRQTTYKKLMTTISMSSAFKPSGLHDLDSSDSHTLNCVVPLDFRVNYFPFVVPFKVKDSSEVKVYESINGELVLASNQVINVSSNVATVTSITENPNADYRIVRAFPYIVGFISPIRESLNSRDGTYTWTFSIQEQ